MRTWPALANDGALGVLRSVVDREVVFERGTAADRAWFLAAGAVEIVQRSAEGTSIVVKILTAPTLFGVIEILGGEPHVLETVRALGGADVYGLPRAAFLDRIARDADAAYECLVDVGAAFCVAARFEHARLHETEALLANLLLAYVDVLGERWDGGVRVAVKRTQAELAEAIGAGERSVNRILADWKDAGLVHKIDARYLVRDRDALVERAGDLRGSLVHRFRAP